MKDIQPPVIVPNNFPHWKFILVMRDKWKIIKDIPFRSEVFLVIFSSW